MAIALADLLDEKQVILRLRSRKPANALREIVQLLAKNGKIDQPVKFLEQVLAREQVHPSAVEHGVSFPHARTDLVDQIILGIGRSRTGIPFGENRVSARHIGIIDASCSYTATRSLSISPAGLTAGLLVRYRQTANATNKRSRITNVAT